jgi:hypothetical protein
MFSFADYLHQMLESDIAYTRKGIKCIFDLN